MLVLASLLLAVAPQGEVHGRGERLVLPREPRVETAPEQQPESPQDGRARAFHKRMQELRRSRHVPESKEAALLLKLGDDFDAVGDRSVKLLRSADADLAHACARALELFGEARHAAELEFLLLTRRYGRATAPLVATMARLARDDAAERLFACLTSNVHALRRAAEDELGTRLRPEHAEHLILLSQQGRDDVRTKALRLLGRVPPEPAIRERLLRALEQSPALAEAAVEALVQHGPQAAGDLQDLLRRPAIGRSFGYAALTLVLLEERSPGVELLTADMREPLLDELEMPDPFQRTAVALALAGLAWRSDDAVGAVWRDRDVVAALVELVDPRDFVDHFALLSKLARDRLATLAGRDFGGRQALWRDWWTRVAEQPRFVAARRRVAFDAERAPTARLTFRGREFILAFRGPDAPAPSELDPPVSAVDDEDAPERLDFLLAPDDFVALVEQLQRAGFMRGTRREAAGEADGRRLELIAGGALARTAPKLATPRLDRLGGLVAAAAEANRWQLYRDPEDQPDAAAWWRAERRWRARHTEPGARAVRLKDGILGRLPELSGARRELAVQHLTTIDELGEMLTTADGLRLAEAAATAPSWDGGAVRILELALLAPGDAVWERLLEVAAAREEAEPGTNALERIFALVEPDRLLAAIRHGKPRVRRTAIEEVAQLQDLRAVPPLLEIAADTAEPLMLRSAAIYALGRLRDGDATQPLVALLDDDELDPELRRTTWVALARIGGDTAFEVLREAFPSPDPLDRRAVVQALGQMREPRAAEQLAGIMVLRGEDALGQLAQEYLRRMGDLLASPALVPHLSHASEGVRGRTALLLAEFQHPAALPELMRMLGEERDRRRTAALIAGITGLDLVAAQDRPAALRSWWERWRGQPQLRWYLHALDEAGVEHSLEAGQLVTDSGLAAVPELCRLATELEQRHLRALTGRMLRQTTGEDHGLISALSTPAQIAAIVDRYRFLYDSAQAVDRR